MKVLLIFLLSFKWYITLFKCDKSSFEIDYIFFIYDSIYNHIDDIKKTLQFEMNIDNFACSKYMLKTISNMKETLKHYYLKTEFSTIYDDEMIFNSHCKFSLFEEKFWEDENV